MDQAIEPFGGLLASIEGWLAEARKQVEEQSNEEILRELNLLVVDITDYLQQARSFEQEWGDLKPKVQAWQAGGDVDALIEYQKKAEAIIRDFHSKSRQTFGEAVKKSDDLARSGSEMTQRRVIHSVMTGLAHTSLAERNKWTVAARSVVPRYNLRLKGLLGAVNDVSPRISERKTFHRSRLTEELSIARAAERQDALQRLRTDLEAAHRRHQQASDEYLKLDTGTAAVEQANDAVQRKKAELADIKSQSSDLEVAIARLDADIARLQESSASGKITPAEYQAFPPAIATGFDARTVRQAVLLGAVVAAIFIVCVAILSRRRRSSPQVAVAS
jgi:DNA repair exonuclease SbcCD ATPase subunit